MDEFKFTKEQATGSISLPRLLTFVGLVPSMSDARRTIEGNGVEIDGKRITDPRIPIDIFDGMQIKAGKKEIAVKIS